MQLRSSDRVPACAASGAPAAACGAGRSPPPYQAPLPHQPDGVVTALRALADAVALQEAEEAQGRLVAQKVLVAQEESRREAWRVQRQSDLNSEA